MTRRYGLWLLLAAVAFFALFNLPRTPTTVDDLPPELLGEPDLYMRGADIVQHDADGDIRYRLLAEEVRHFDRPALTQLEQPRLTLFRVAEPPSHGRALRGVLRMHERTDGNTEEVLELLDDVVLVQEQPKGRHTTLTTNLLHIYPDRRYAETDRPAMIVSDAGRTEGVGLRADLVSGLFDLGTDSDERVLTIVHPRPRPRTAD